MTQLLHNSFDVSQRTQEKSQAWRDKFSGSSSNSAGKGQGIDFGAMLASTHQTRSAFGLSHLGGNYNLSNGNGKVSRSVETRENIASSVSSSRKNTAYDEAAARRVKGNARVSKLESSSDKGSSELEKIQKLKELKDRLEKWIDSAQTKTQGAQGVLSQEELANGHELLTELLALLGDGAGGMSMDQFSAAENQYLWLQGANGAGIAGSEQTSSFFEQSAFAGGRLARALGLQTLNPLNSSGGEKALAELTQQALKFVENLLQASSGSSSGEGFVQDLKTFLDQFKETLQGMTAQAEGEDGGMVAGERLLRGGQEGMEHNARPIGKSEMNPTHLQNGSNVNGTPNGTPLQQNLSQSNLFHQGQGQNGQAGQSGQSGNLQWANNAHSQASTGVNSVDDPMSKDFNSSGVLPGEKGTQVKLAREFTPFSSRLNSSVLLNKLVSGVKTAAFGGREIFTLTLKPANLGEVSVLMKKAQNQFTVKLVVENVVVKEMVEEQLSELKSQLARENIDLTGLDVEIEHRENSLSSNNAGENLRQNSEEGFMGKNSHSSEVVELREDSIEGARLHAGTGNLSLVI